MQIRTINYSGRSFDPSKLPATYGALAALYPDEPMTVRIDSASAKGEQGLKLLREAVKPDSRITFSLESASSKFQVETREVWDLRYVAVSSGDEKEGKRIHEIVRGTLGLLDPTSEELDSEASLYSINQRVLKLQALVRDLPSKLATQAQSTRLRCFVSFKFDEHNKALALELRNFLELAGLEFISGLGYEPRSVSEKVLERLGGELDLFVVMFGTGSESTWLHQEIGVAKGRGLPVMVLKEEGTAFDEGLLSDIEYASFPRGHISGAFIPVLQAVQYIRLRRDAPGRK